MIQKLGFSFLLLFISCISIGQIDYSKNIQGIKQGDNRFYNLEGYSVFKTYSSNNLDEKGIKKIKREYDIPNYIKAVSLKDNPSVKILALSRVKDSVKLNLAYYLAKNEKGKTEVVSFSTVCSRDKSIEEYLFQKIANNSISDSVYTSDKVDTVLFAGRPIILGPACRWMEVRNLQCPNLGQMNWSEFSTKERAAEMIAIYKSMNEKKKLGRILNASDVNISFEGSDVLAYKTKTKIKIPQFVMGGSNVLITYYVLAEVRGRYVACILSHYTDDVGADTLPPLLSEVMELK